MSVLHCECGQQQVANPRSRQRRLSGYDLLKQFRPRYAVVAALLECDAEDLAPFEHGRRVIRIDLEHQVAAALLAPEYLERLRFVAGSDYAVGYLAAEQLRSRHVHHVAERGHVAKRRDAIDAARARIGRGERRKRNLAHCIGLAQGLTERYTHGGAGWANVLERGSRRQFQSVAELFDQLPGVERIQQVDVPGRAIEHGEGQGVAAFAAQCTRRCLMRVHAIP